MAAMACESCLAELEEADSCEDPSYVADLAL